MPGKLKAKIVAGRHLPVMDRASDLTDAFVEVSNVKQVFLIKLTSSIQQCVSSILIDFQVKFGNTTFKTDVCPKSLNPQWNSEWFKFEVKLRSLCKPHPKPHPTSELNTRFLLSG